MSFDPLHGGHISFLSQAYLVSPTSTQVLIQKRMVCMHSCSVAQQMLSRNVESVLTTEPNTSEQRSTCVELCSVQCGERFNWASDSPHVWKLSNAIDYMF